jgi:signal transduction histidine kinase
MTMAQDAPDPTQLAQATPAPATPNRAGGGGGEADDRQAELAEIIQAYNEVTERLQKSHEHLQAEVVRLREELASTNAQLQRSKRLSALGEMAAGIAHEIRNPLGAIQLYANMAGDDLSGDQPALEDAQRNLQKIASAVRGLNGIVNDVLSFARELEPSAQPLDVAEQFDKALQAHEPAIDEAGIAIERRDQQRSPDQRAVQADANLLQQALVNLIRNAVDAMQGASDAGADDSGQTTSLILDAEPDQQGLTLTVRDTGPGIADADIDRIFNPFFTTRGTGTGLGLAIVHRIVDAHGGTVSVHNDGGAVFQLALPSKPPSATAGAGEADTHAHEPALSGKGGGDE